MFSKARAFWLAASCCVSVVCALAIVSSHSRDMSSTPVHSEVAALSMATSTTQVAPDVLLVSLLPTGFEPSEVSHPAGKFLFGVNNRTGLPDLRFQLTNDAGKPVGEKRMEKEKTWRKVIEPTPGRYVLRVVGHPSWVCEVVITP